MNYLEMLKDVRWQKLRLQILELHQWKCDTCDSAGRPNISLEVHHKFYKQNPGKNGFERVPPWDYNLDDFKVLCEACHEQTEIALMELRRVFGSFDYFTISTFVTEFEKKIADTTPQQAINWLLFSMSSEVPV